MKKYYLFLDDIREPKDVTWTYLPNKPWIIVRNYSEFVHEIESKGYLPDMISFDHDLSDDHYENYNGIDGEGRLIINYDKFEEKTGYSCAKWLINYCEQKNFDIPAYLVHSMNPVGAKNIRDLLSNYKWKKINEKIG